MRINSKNAKLFTQLELAEFLGVSKRTISSLQNGKMFNFYKCPKKHEEGLIRKKKTNRKSKEALKRPKCKECDRELIKIDLDEFMPLIEKSILDRWGIKK